MFNVGDKVIYFFKSNKIDNLELLKTYKIESYKILYDFDGTEYIDYNYVILEGFKNCIFNIQYFLSVSEYRKMKLEKLCSM